MKERMSFGLRLSKFRTALGVAESAQSAKLSIFSLREGSLVSTVQGNRA